MSRSKLQGLLQTEHIPSLEDINKFIFEENIKNGYNLGNSTNRFTLVLTSIIQDYNSENETNHNNLILPSIVYINNPNIYSNIPSAKNYNLEMLESLSKLSFIERQRTSSSNKYQINNKEFFIAHISLIYGNSEKIKNLTIKERFFWLYLYIIYPEIKSNQLFQEIYQDIEELFFKLQKIKEDTDQEIESYNLEEDKFIDLCISSAIVDKYWILRNLFKEGNYRILSRMALNGHKLYHHEGIELHNMVIQSIEKKDITLFKAMAFDFNHINNSKHLYEIIDKIQEIDNKNIKRQFIENLFNYKKELNPLFYGEQNSINMIKDMIDSRTINHLEFVLNNFAKYNPINSQTTILHCFSNEILDFGNILNKIEDNNIRKNIIDHIIKALLGLLNDKNILNQYFDSIAKNIEFLINSQDHHYLKYVIENLVRNNNGQEHEIILRCFSKNIINFENIFNKIKDDNIRIAITDYILISLFHKIKKDNSSNIILNQYMNAIFKNFYNIYFDDKENNGEWIIKEILANDSFNKNAYFKAFLKTLFDISLKDKNPNKLKEISEYCSLENKQIFFSELKKYIKESKNISLQIRIEQMGFSIKSSPEEVKNFCIEAFDEAVKNNDIQEIIKFTSTRYKDHIKNNVRPYSLKTLLSSEYNLSIVQTLLQKQVEIISIQDAYTEDNSTISVLSYLIKYQNEKILFENLKLPKIQHENLCKTDKLLISIYERFKTKEAVEASICSLDNNIGLVLNKKNSLKRALYLNLINNISNDLNQIEYEIINYLLEENPEFIEEATTKHNRTLPEILFNKGHKKEFNKLLEKNISVLHREKLAFLAIEKDDLEAFKKIDFQIGKIFEKIFENNDVAETQIKNYILENYFYNVMEYYINSNNPFIPNILIEHLISRKPSQIKEILNIQKKNNILHILAKQSMNQKNRNYKGFHKVVMHINKNPEDLHDYILAKDEAGNNIAHLLCSRIYANIHTSENPEASTRRMLRLLKRIITISPNILFIPNNKGEIPIQLINNLKEYHSDHTTKTIVDFIVYNEIKYVKNFVKNNDYSDYEELFKKYKTEHLNNIKLSREEEKKLKESFKHLCFANKSSDNYSFLQSFIDTLITIFTFGYATTQKEYIKNIKIGTSTNIGYFVNKIRIPEADLEIG